MYAAINLDPEDEGVILLYPRMVHMENNRKMVLVGGDKILD